MHLPRNAKQAVSPEDMDVSHTHINATVQSTRKMSTELERLQCFLAKIFPRALQIKMIQRASLSILSDHNSNIIHNTVTSLLPVQIAIVNQAIRRVSTNELRSVNGLKRENTRQLRYFRVNF